MNHEALFSGENKENKSSDNYPNSKQRVNTIFTSYNFLTFATPRANPQDEILMIFHRPR